MSITILERVELTIEDFSIPCDYPGCDNAAIYAVQTFCCLKLRCEHCISRMLTIVAAHIGRNAFCIPHRENHVRADEVSDVIKSIDPI